MAIIRLRSSKLKSPVRSNFPRGFFPCIFSFLLVIAALGENSLADFAGRDTSVHDPSTLVKCDEEFWLFATGRGIASRYSADLKHWETGPPVFPQVPSWTTNMIPANNGRFWAPDVAYLSNRYVLYYAVSSWGRRNSVIGLATNLTLNPKDAAFHWVDKGPVIRTTEQDDYNAIDPAVLQCPDGRMWLAFGSYWSGIKLVELNPETGLRIAPESPIHSLAWHESIEASYIYRHGPFYYLFVNWGQCCRGVHSTYNIRIGRSAEVTGPYLDKDGLDMLHDGGTSFLESSGDFIGPGHAGIIAAKGRQWFSCHFYDGRSQGKPTLGILPLTWDDDGWPKAETNAAN